MRTPAFLIAALITLGFGIPPSFGAAEAPHPNIVFLLADDLGWADLGCYGSTFYETPNIDRLAREGVRFNTYYTAGSICSPTRASLMTGKYPVRTGITDYIPGMKIPPNSRFNPAPTKMVLDPHEFTLGRAFRAAGYQTFYVGKWHLGPTSDGLQDYGFDHYASTPDANDEDARPSGKTKAGKSRNAKSSSRAESTSLFTKAAIDFMEKRDPSKPFFLMLSYVDVHTPIHARADTIEHYRAREAALPPAPSPIPEHHALTRPRQDDAAYASVVATVDKSVAQIRQQLEALGLSHNTIVVFASDNGGLSTHKAPGPTNNSPLRAGKGWLYEGGIRAPLIVHLPAAANEGTVCDVPIISTDIYPTFLDLAGLPLRPEQHVDGVSVASLIRGKEAPARSTFYWHYPHYHGSTWAPGAAIRDGDWKLIEFYDPQSVELYNLRMDASERQNLASENPARVKELLDKLHTWQKSSGAIMPAPNPNYKPHN